MLGSEAGEVTSDASSMLATGLLGSAGRGHVRKLHGGFQRVVQKGGVWAVSKGRGQAAVPPPLWLWDGLASFAPEVRAACQLCR